MITVRPVGPVRCLSRSLQCILTTTAVIYRLTLKTCPLMGTRRLSPSRRFEPRPVQLMMMSNSRISRRSFTSRSMISPPAALNLKRTARWWSMECHFLHRRECVNRRVWFAVVYLWLQSLTIWQSTFVNTTATNGEHSSNDVRMLHLGIYLCS